MPGTRGRLRRADHVEGTAPGDGILAAEGQRERHLSEPVLKVRLIVRGE